MAFVWTSAQHQQLLALCQQHGVEKLWVFGSAATGTFDPARSDLDFGSLIWLITQMTLIFRRANRWFAL